MTWGAYWNSLVTDTIKAISILLPYDHMNQPVNTQENMTKIINLRIH